MDSRKTGKTPLRAAGDIVWVEVVRRTWRPTPITGSTQAAIVQYPGNGFEAWVYSAPHKGKSLGAFKTFGQAARAIAKAA